jgi:hypothetical protein
MTASFYRLATECKRAVLLKEAQVKFYIPGLDTGARLLRQASPVFLKMQVE